MIGGEQNAHPAAREAGGEARRDEGLARRFVAKDFFQQSNAVAIGEGAADRVMIDEYCHEHDSPVIRPILYRVVGCGGCEDIRRIRRTSLRAAARFYPFKRTSRSEMKGANRIRTRNASV